MSLPSTGMKIKEGKILNQLPLICIIRANTKHIQKPHLYEMPKHAVQSNSTRSEKKIIIIKKEGEKLFHALNINFFR